jgi:hypothetical protein
VDYEFDAVKGGVYNFVVADGTTILIEMHMYGFAMELHYIDMKAFAKAVNEKDSIGIGDTEEVMFAKWLSVITQKEITNKAIIRNACDEEEIFMAVTALARQSEDKILRQAYQRRKDEIYFYNKERTEYIQRAEQAEAENEKLRKEIEMLRTNQKP